MEPKKNAGADLESKRTLFFLFGIALSLTATILIIQIERSVTAPVIPKTEVAVITTSMPRTVQNKKEEKVVKKLEKFNEKLPPEEIPDDVKLEIKKLFNGPEDDSPDLKDIKILDDLDDVETVGFAVIENIARPMECEGVSDKEAQKACFNLWIQRYISQNTNYPELARQMHLEDKVFVEFVISETGIVEGVSLAKGQYEILNDEALRVLGTMPEMTPGSQRGRKVKMKMTVPVNFKLSK